jgi:hypothetical protein
VFGEVAPVDTSGGTSVTVVMTQVRD